MTIKNYSDQKLLTETRILVLRERECTHRVLVHLQEIERRRLYLDFGHRTINEYCMVDLGYTAGEAQYRIAAMRLMKGSPEIEKAVETGELTLTNAVIASNYIASSPKTFSLQEKEEVVRQVLGKSKEEAILNLRPAREELENKARGGKQFQIRVDEETKELLAELARISRQGEREILKNVLQEKISALKQKRENQAAKAPMPALAKSRHISASAQARVRIRAQERCESINNLGVRCACTKDLQLDHIKPFALGGDSSAENIRLLCRSHNLRRAIRTYGADKMAKYLSH